MRLFNIDMQDLKDYFICLIALTIAFFNNFISIKLIGITSLFITLPEFHEYLIDIKDVISLVTVSITCFIMILKLRRILKLKYKK